MQAMTPISPLERGGEMFSRAKTMSVFLESWNRPVSVVTDTTEFEGQDHDDLSDFDSGSLSRSASPDSGKRRSQTTIASFDEAPTPKSGRGQRRLPLQLQSVEGPKGPHLFRSSQTSADFELALQMSPMLPKQMDLLRSDTAFSQNTVTPIIMPDQTFDFSIDSAIDRRSNSSTSSEIRTWSSTRVIDWLVDAGMESGIIACFERHDITGDVLMDLTFEDLKDLGVESFGKRHQLWNVLCILQGRPDDLSPCQTTFDDISRPCTSRPGRSESRDAFTPIDDSTGKKRRGRKPSKTRDIITPAESVSIVAIEQLLPKAHKCAKGERCAKWRKQQRELQRLQDEHELGQWPISPTKGGHIFVAGNPGNASTAHHMQQTFPQAHQPDDFYRPQSTAEPSVVASSDLLGPGQLPEFILHADMLDQLDKRDPQENVKAFLSFQHVHSPCVPMEEDLTDAILTPVQSKFNAAPEPAFEMFPSEHVPSFAAQPAFQLPVRPHTSNQQLHRTLPRLDIPRSSSAQAQATMRTPVAAREVARSATASPSGLYRFDTPASEMDVPMSVQPAVQRSTSQSVPPDMQYRQQKPLSRSQSRGKWRRPSVALESVREHEILSPGSGSRPSMSTQRTGSSGCNSMRSTLDPAHDVPETKVFGYGTDCTQAGWMRKRKTKLLRHEWQDAHFRLKGSELAMHADEKYHTAAKETIDVDQYSVACSSGPSSSKLGAAFKSLAIKNASPEKKGKAVDPTAFAFQLVPESKDKQNFSSAKTHHFAVKTKDERIDWMRELMLAKALQQKRDGYEVEVNGVQA